MTETPATTTRLRGLLARFRRDRSGVSAVEFALILPLMIVLYIGVVEITQAIAASRKASAAAGALGDLTTQASEITTAEMTNVFTAARAVMQPYDTGRLNMRVTQVQIDARGNATVACSRGAGMTPLTRGAAFTSLPAGLRTPNTFLVFAEASYGYVPIVGWIDWSNGMFSLNRTVANFGDQFYNRPRIGDCVRFNTGATNDCTC